MDDANATLTIRTGVTRKMLLSPVLHYSPQSDWRTAPEPEPVKTVMSTTFDGSLQMKATFADINRRLANPTASSKSDPPALPVGK